jgi:hypothetical protein
MVALRDWTQHWDAVLRDRERAGWMGAARSRAHPLLDVSG